MSLLTSRVLSDIVASLQPSYPSEGCGLVLLNSNGSVRVQPCSNLADELHAQDPESFPRTSRTFYAIDPMEFLEAEKLGDQVRIIYHSHCDVADYFSDEDRLVATMGMGEEAGPAYPGCSYLVVSVIEGVASHATHYGYSDETLRFEPVEVFADFELV